MWWFNASVSAMSSRWVALCPHPNPTLRLALPRNLTPLPGLEGYQVPHRAHLEAISFRLEASPEPCFQPETCNPMPKREDAATRQANALGPNSADPEQIEAEWEGALAAALKASAEP